jgi:serine phosphatase RsbU (regulator of sigma subunit)/anti-sigma regulatory factor (Ser/Thr protein kinase)
MTGNTTHSARCAALRLTIECRLAEVRPATLEVRAFLLEQGLREEEIAVCELALAEACNNAIQHAGESDRQKPLEVGILCNGTKIELRVTDHTPGFDWPERVKLPPLESEGGRGLFVIHSLMDEAAYLRGQDENNLVMRKSRCIQGYRHATAAPASLDAAYHKLVESERVIGDMTRELCFRSETLAAIFHWSAELGRTNDLGDFSQRLLTDLLHISSTDWFVLRVVPADQPNLVVLSASEPALRLPPLPVPTASQPNLPAEAEAAATRRDVWFDRGRPLARSDPLVAVKPDSLGLVRPFTQGERLIGTLTVGRNATQPPLNAAQEGVVNTFADFLAVQIVNARLQAEQFNSRLVSHELEIARNIQRAQLPRSLPQLRGLGLAGFFESARQVGGDFYDVLQLSDSSLLLVVADVMGRGVPAALFAGNLRTLVRANVEYAKQPSELLGRINRQMFDDLSHVDMFITAQLVFVDVRKRLLTAANAGHCPVLLAGLEENRVISLSPEGIPIGILPGAVFAHETVPLGRRCRVILYTDGVTEARNSQGELFGQRRLSDWLLKTTTRNRTAELLKNELGAELSRYQSHAPLADDRSFLILAEEKTPAPAGRSSKKHGSRPDVDAPAVAGAAQ